ncbi:hypothetical protein ESC46_20730 [Escherichia coli]|nr:hypothetical protein [Escherichia coli]
MELTAGDRAAPDWTYFSVMLMPENQTVMVGAELRHRVVASPRKARTTVVAAHQPVHSPQC